MKNNQLLVSDQENLDRKTTPRFVFVTSYHARLRFVTLEPILVVDSLNLEQIEEMIEAKRRRHTSMKQSKNLTKLSVSRLLPYHKTNAWISGNKPSAKLLSLQCSETQSKILPKFTNLMLY